MPQGNRGHIGIKKETTWGTRDGVDTNDVFLPFVSETLTADIEDVVSAIQRGERDEPKSYHGERAFGGDLVIEVHPKSIGHILRSAINIPDPTGTVCSTTVTTLCDCETVWENDGACITSLDPNDKKKGLYSSKIQVPADVVADQILASREVADDLRTTSHYKFWIKSSIVLAAGNLQFVVSETALGAVGAEGYDKVDIPAMPLINTWYEFSIAVTPGAIDDMEATISCAILTVAAGLAEFTLHIDDIRILETGAPASTDAKQHVFTPIKTHAQEFHDDCPLRPYTLEVYKDDGGNAFEFMGAVVNKLSLSFSAADKILKATCGILARDLDSIAPTAIGLETTNPFMWDDAKIFVAAKDAAVDITLDTDRCNDLESFKVDFDNNCIAKFALNNTAIARKFIFNGYVAIPVNFTIDFINQTEFDNFIAGTEKQFIIVLDGDIIKASEPTFRYRLRIDMPLVRYTAYPITTGGPGRLSAAVVGKAKYSSHADWLYAIRFTVWNKQDNTEYA